ncbi:MAG: hypothetical protein ACRCVI_01280 [Mycoplasmoidaceae bacterium]
MNKKIKLSLLGALFAGTVAAVAIPIVSCSASDVTTVKFAWTETPEAGKAAIATAVRTKAGTESVEVTAVITKAQYESIIGDVTDATLKSAILATLKFTNGDKTVPTTDVVDTVKIEGTYPEAAGNAVIKVSYTVKKGFKVDGATSFADIVVGIYEAPAPAIK